MKLRNRTTRVISDVKQENCKPAPNATGESTSILDSSSNSCGLIIKQEDAKDDKALLEQHGDEFGTKDYRYQCDMCNQRMPNRKSVLEHRFSVHNIKSGTSRTIKDINVEPDIHDPNFYCKSCQQGYTNRSRFRHHLRRTHFLALKKLPSCKVPLKGIFPDPDDPKLYCKACNHTYASKINYKRHCRYIHGVTSFKSANQKSNTSSNMIDTYCQACDRRFSSTLTYRRHLFIAHRVNRTAIQQQKQSDIVPDADDPNFYCCSCNKKLANKKSFRKHLKEKHSIFHSAPRKQSLCKPDIDDPNNYCRACQKTYSHKSSYRAHLRVVHRMALPPLKIPIDRINLPDPHNPDHYCSVCKKRYTLSHLYRQHCKNVHFMTLYHVSIVNPNAKIDINDPGFFCAQCERSFSSSLAFKQHLGRVHSI
ncbi:hypothetical protein V8B55DRAFT_1380612 [Mucor lusitanicus]|uniref:C2H2-type domain-containing protein n=1 Tax=Mucor circinelloides f. lusitanicus TaxID=29924 RepID=A0A8H4F428_MUCCL|nr:hypothetical protein FB192DRAFT_1363187 [Mucor lusitanicus]